MPFWTKSFVLSIGFFALSFSAYAVDAPVPEEKKGFFDVLKGLATGIGDIPGDEMPMAVNPEDMLPDTQFKARISLLDKRTDHNYVYELTPGVPIYHKNITISAYNCLEDMDGIDQNNSAFLEVQDAEGIRIFSGWVYEKYASVSGMDHAHYNITLHGCDVTQPAS